MHGWCPKVPLLSFILSPDISLSNSVCAASLLSSAIPALAQVLMVSVHLVSHPSVSLFFLPQVHGRGSKTCCIFPFLSQGRRSCHSCYGQPSGNRGSIWNSRKEPRQGTTASLSALLWSILPTHSGTARPQILFRPIWVRFLSLVIKDILTNALGPVQPTAESQGRVFYLLMVVTGRRNL